jgi:hypothetical protein
MLIHKTDIFTFCIKMFDRHRMRQKQEGVGRQRRGQTASFSGGRLPGQELDSDRLPRKPVRGMLADKTCQLLPQEDTQGQAAGNNYK